jgi:cobalamin biosynthesis protein CobD/CbiB
VVKTPTSGRPLVFVLAVGLQMFAGAPPARRGEASGAWLAWLAQQPAAALPPGSREARLAGIAAPVVLARMVRVVERCSGFTGSAGQALLLASTFEVVTVDRRAARIQKLLEAGDVRAASAELVLLTGMESELANGFDARVVTSETIAALARRPESYLVQWLTYSLFGLRGVTPLALRPAWQFALGWRSPLAQRLTGGRVDPLVRLVSDQASAMATALVAPVVQSTMERAVRVAEDSEAPTELSTMAGALDRSLVVDGEVVNGEAPPALPEDIRRARRVGWSVAALLAGGTVATMVGLGGLRRAGRWLGE